MSRAALVCVLIALSCVSCGGSSGGGGGGGTGTMSLSATDAPLDHTMDVVEGLQKVRPFQNYTHDETGSLEGKGRSPNRQPASI